MKTEKEQRKELLEKQVKTKDKDQNRFIRNAKEVNRGND